MTHFSPKNSPTGCPRPSHTCFRACPVLDTGPARPNAHLAGTGPRNIAYLTALTTANYDSTKY